MNYEMTIAGLKRSLPLFPINENLQIAAFIMLGDTEITEACARELLKKAPDYDILITAECKGIPLTYEMAKQAGKSYIVARKSPKLYMKDVLTVHSDSITTEGIQTLCLGGDDAQLLKGKRVLITDDVISTGGSLSALEKLVRRAGGEIAGKMAVLAEGDAAVRDDIIFLEALPLFDKDGKVI
ncbi:MAG: phosphoribosyltransferase family protein [Clostridiales bacterium]|nr:phosphoribosyltransferase family protein [Clostridiales bacterium]